MQFVYPALTWAFFLLLVPVLIHLINLMRHRRVQWAAMAFLYQSSKKHRKWIWLKQLALLLLRMVALAAVVAMSANLVSLDQWSGLWGEGGTHHFVLLDDSYSMSDRVGEETVFQQAKKIVERIVEQADTKKSRQKITFIRFSQASAMQSNQEASAENANSWMDLQEETIQEAFLESFRELNQDLEVTHLATEPATALRALKKVFQESSGDNRIVYIVSDFRLPQWESPAEAKKILQELEAENAAIHFIQCVNSSQPNLGITYLATGDSTRATNVPLFVDVKVKNFSQQPRTNVRIKFRSYQYGSYRSSGNVLKELKPHVEELPPEYIEKIEPGETAGRRVQVFFSSPGQHVVEAMLPEDAVATDNSRRCVVDIPLAEQVLVLDGHPRQHNWFYLKSVFEPGQRAVTGIKPVLQSPVYLRDIPSDDLQKYSAIFFLDVVLDEFVDTAIEKLEAYVRAGGGVVFFLGPNANPELYNEKLYKNNQGLLPVALSHSEEFISDQELSPSSTDIQVEDHPVFRVFAGQNSVLLSNLQIGRYFLTDRKQTPQDGLSNTRIISRIKNGKPLVAEKLFGNGRSLVFLTTLAPDWNNWARSGPGFVVVLLHLQSYLASSHRLDNSRLVGTPLSLSLDIEKYRPEVQFVVPQDIPMSRQAVSLMAVAKDENVFLVDVSLSGSNKNAPGSETNMPGIYEKWKFSNEGDSEVQRYALNVDPREGDLSTISPQQLLEALRPVKLELHSVEEVGYGVVEESVVDWSEIILYFLIFFLLAEQILAYSASYHPSQRTT